MAIKAKALTAQDRWKLTDDERRQIEADLLPAKHPRYRRVPIAGSSHPILHPPRCIKIRDEGIIKRVQMPTRSREESVDPRWPPTGCRLTRAGGLAPVISKPEPPLESEVPGNRFELLECSYTA
jgi:hypothetical protein